MKNTFGNTVAVTLFGESHGPCIGAVIDGLPAGLPVDMTLMEKRMALRHGDPAVSTARREPDTVLFESGVFRGHTTGSPLCLRIENKDVNDAPYEEIEALARPSHADYPLYARYGEWADRRGGGHASGRLTAPLVAAGVLAETALAGIGVTVATQILSVGTLAGRRFSLHPESELSVRDLPLPTLDKNFSEEIKEAALAAKAEGKSLGGVTETVICGLPAGVGEPFFDTLEGMLAHAAFAVPAIKGIAFGDGFDLSRLTAPEANDELRPLNGAVVHTTNHMGGIDGGLTNGNPVVFTCAVKPTPSVPAVQKTVDLKTGKEAEITVTGRHDPAVVTRVSPVLTAVSELTVLDLLCTRFGTDFITKKL